jgi:hypothetical protein
MENHGGMVSIGEIPYSVNQSSLVFLKQSHLVANQKEVAKQMNFA